jgi:hypothetical protein
MDGFERPRAGKASSYDRIGCSPAGFIPTARATARPPE